MRHFQTEHRSGSLRQRGRIPGLRSGSNTLGCVDFHIMAHQNWKSHSDGVLDPLDTRERSDILRTVPRRSLTLLPNPVGSVTFPKNIRSYDGWLETFHEGTGYHEASPPRGHAEARG